MYEARPSKPTVLIVEDEVLVRLVIAEHLQDSGYRVYEACNVSEALTILESDVSIDIVFSDINMPGERNGIALARWLTANRPSLKLILASGRVTQEELPVDLRDVAHLQKPFDMESAEAKIIELMGH